MANNELLIKKTAVLDGIAIGNIAATHGQGVFIPAGAIITGITLIAPGAVTTTDASATIVLKVGTFPIVATTKINAAIPAQTVGTKIALLTTAGLYVPTTGELNLVVSASANSSCNATVDIYVDYMYIAS
jgi:hypothetical protein